MKTILFTVMFLTFYLHSWGQTVTGRVVSDEEKQSLEGATVQILNAERQLANHTVTDKQGRFKIDTNLTNFSCRINYVGFEDIQLTIDNTELKNRDLGDIVMYADSSTILTDVLVQADVVEERTDKTIVFPTSAQLAVSTSGIDLLKNVHLPGLFVDPVMQNVQIDGSSNVMYRINGINASLKDVIALKADLIRRIEYSPTSSIRDLGTYSGVINIVLKEQTTGTYLYANALGAVTTGFLNGNANLKRIYGHSELSLNYNVNWRDYKKRWSRENESYNMPTDTTHYYRKGRNAPFGYLTQNIDISYILNKDKNVFQARFLNTINSIFDRNYVDTYMFGQETALYFRNIHARSKIYIPSLDLYYSHKYDDKQGLEINLVGTIIESDYKRDLTDSYTSKDEYIYNATDGNKKSLLFEGYYYNRKSKLQYDLGIKGSYGKTENAYYNQGKSNITRMELYPYISINGKIRHLSYTLGTGFKILKTDDRLVSKQYYRNLSTLSLFYKKEDNWDIRNVLQFTPSFPSLSHFYQIDQRQDSLMVIRGNSSMKPSQTIYNKLTINYQPKNDIRLSFSMNASKTFDAMGVNYYYDSVINSFVTQSDNHDYTSVLGASADASFSSILNIFNVSAGIVWNKYKTKGVDFTHRLSNLYWYVFCNAKIKDFSFDVGYRRPSKSLSSQIVYLNENYSSIGVSYRKKSFSASTGIMFPFTSGTKYGLDRKSLVTPSSRKIYIRDNANMFYLNLSYYISWGKSSSNINKNLRNSDYDAGITRIRDN